MRAVVFSGGSISDYNYIKELISSDDMIIAADSGFDHVSKLGITADAYIGDMDSVKNTVVCKEIIRLEVMKDETDTEAASMLAVSKGADEILLLAATGTRMDHTLANLLLLKKLYDMKIQAVVVDEHNEIRFLKDKISVSGEKGDTLSIIPLSTLSGVTTSGLLYQLNDGILEFGASMGVSNVMTDNICTIEIKNGEALIIKSRD